MKRLEKILAFAAITGLVLKFNLIIGGAILFTIGLFPLALIYALFGFAYFNQIPLKRIFKKDSYNDSKLKSIGIAIGTGISIAIVLTGIWLKVQNWPRANFILLTGAISSVIMLVLTILEYLHSRYLKFKGSIIRLIIISFLGIVSFGLSYRNVVALQFRNHPRYIEAYDQYQKDSENLELGKQLDLEYRRATMSEKMFEKYMELEYEEKE